MKKNTIDVNYNPNILKAFQKYKSILIRYT